MGLGWLFHHRRSIGFPQTKSATVYSDSMAAIKVVEETKWCYQERVVVEFLPTNLRLQAEVRPGAESEGDTVDTPKG